MVTNPQAYKELTWTFFTRFLYIVTWHQYNFNSNKWFDSVHPRPFWRCQMHHVNRLPNDFVQSIFLAKKNVFKCWYISKRCCFFEGCIVVFQTPVQYIQYPKNISDTWPEYSSCACRVYFNHSISFPNVYPCSKVFTVSLFSTWHLYRITGTKVLDKIANVDTGQIILNKGGP